MFKKIPDTKTLEGLLRAWHSKRAMTNFFLPEEEYLPVAKKWMVMRFEHGCYLIFEKKEHYDFYFFLDKGTLPVAVPEMDKPLVLEQVCLERKGTKGIRMGGSWICALSGTETAYDAHAGRHFRYP